MWPRAVVTEASLATCIQELRTVWTTRHPRYIETMHRRGYRFIFPALSKRPRTTLCRWSRRRSVVGHDAAGQLAGALEPARAGARQVVFISGEAGIGKTALVETFIRSVPVSSDTRITRADCMERYGGGEAYQPLLDALTRLCRRSGREQSIAILRKFAPAWLAQLPALQAPGEFRTLQRRTAGVTPPRMLRELTDALEVMSTHSLSSCFSRTCIGATSRRSTGSALRRRASRHACFSSMYRSDEIHATTTALQGMVGTAQGPVPRIVLGGSIGRRVRKERYPPAARDQEAPLAALPGWSGPHEIRSSS